MGISTTPDGGLIYVTNFNGGTVSVVSTSTNAVSATIPVGVGPISLGNFITGGSGCNGSPVTFTITVKPGVPAITTTGATGSIVTCAGGPSSSPNIQQFTVSATSLTGNITATAPAAFEISLNAGSNYNNTITLVPVAGKLNNVTVYVRSKASAIGNIAGNVSLSSAGVTTQIVAVSGVINPLPSVNQVNNQIVVNGAATNAIDFTGTATAFNWFNDTPNIGLASSGTGNISSFAAVNAGNTPITATITATPVSSGFAYVANNGSNTVSLINTATNKVISEIPVGNSPYGVSVSTDGSEAYVTNYILNGTVSVIKTATNSVIATIPVGAYPIGVLVSPNGRFVYVANAGSNTVSVISTATYSVIATIAQDITPLSLTNSPDGNFIYVSNNSSNNILIISAATNTVTGNMTVNSPRGICLSPDGNLMYVASQNLNAVLVINTLTHAVLATIPVGGNPFGITLNSDGSRLYVANAESKTVSVINTATQAVIATIPTDDHPVAVSISFDGTQLYVVNQDANDVSVINTATNKVISTINVGIAPQSLGHFIKWGSGCTGLPVTFNITVNPSITTPPAITATGAIGNIVTCAGAPSSSPNIQQSTVSGTSLTGNITATGPVGFEVSLTATGGYGNSVILSQTGGKVNSSIVYVRSAASALGSITGNVVLSSPGVPSQNVAVKGFVNKVPTADPVPPKSVIAGSVVPVINFTGAGNTFNWVNDSPGIGLAASGTGNIPAFTSVNGGSTPFIANVTVTPVIAGLAYIPNHDDNNVSVINTFNNKVVATIDVGEGPAAVSVSPDGGRAYIVNSISNTVSVISTLTNSVIATFNVGEGPTGIVISADGSLLYVANQYGNSLSVINTATNTVTATIPTGEQPTAMTVSADGTRLYLTNSVSNTVSVFNTANNGLIATIPTNLLPFGISRTADGNYLYVTNKNSNNVLVISTATNAIVATIPVGKAPFSHGSFITGGIGCIGAPISFTITVNPNLATTIMPGAVTGSIIACAGSAAVSPKIAQFKVSGINLSGNITATAPATFEVSLDANSGYAKNVALTQSGGKVTDVVVYVRSAASASAGDLSGSVSLTSPGAPTQNVPVTGSVYTLPTANAIAPLTYDNGKATAPINFNGTGGAYNWVNNTPGIGLPASGTGDITSFIAKNTGGVPVTATITVTPQPSGYAYIPNGQKLADDSKSVSVINTSTNKVVATIPVGSDPFGVAVSPNGSRVYIANRGSNFISVISTASNMVISTITLDFSPLGIAITPDGKRLYVTYGGITDSFSVVDLSTNSVTNIRASYFYYGVVASPDGGRVYMANSINNDVSVINTTTNAVEADILTGFQSYGVALSPDGSRLYVANSYSNNVTVVNTGTYNIITSIPVGNDPNGIVMSPDGNRVYISNEASNNVSVINTADNTVVATVPTGSSPFGISITPDGGRVYVVNNVSQNVSVINTADNTVIATTPVGVFPEGLGNFIMGPVACDGKPITFTITVNPPPLPVIAAAGNLSGLHTIYGTPSPSTNFIVSGTDLREGILVTPPAGFEVSADDKTFTGTITVGAAGTVTATKVYIRLAATTPVDSYSGDIILSSTVATDVKVAIPLSTVGPAPLTITADDKTKLYRDENPVLTVTYKGFVNGEKEDVLTTPPQITTAATAASLVGNYPIVVSGAEAHNYDILPVNGVLHIKPDIYAFVIPNTFTPNGDGVNDAWNIKTLESFPGCTVDIYSRYGQLAFESRGYPKPWDGMINGKLVPSGTFYYIINLNDGSKPLAGYVAVIR